MQLSDDDKWALVQKHFEKAYRVKFQATPKTGVVDYLYGELKKFQETTSWLFHQNPSLEEKINLETGTQIVKAKPRLLVLENLAKEYPDEFTKL